MRDLIKDAPLIEWLWREERVKKPNSQRESNLGPLDPYSKEIPLELPPRPETRVPETFRELLKSEPFNFPINANQVQNPEDEFKFLFIAN